MLSTGVMTLGLFRDIMNSMKKIKAFLTIITLIAVAFGPAFLVYADDSTPTPVVQPTDSSVTASASVASVDTASADVTASSDVADLTTGSDMTAELAVLQAKEQDPTTGFFAKIWIDLKIKEIENQINVQNAVQQ